VTDHPPADPGLFDAEPYLVEHAPAAPIEDLSPDRRRTLRHAADIANGRHPLAGAPLHPDAPSDAARGDRSRPFTCGTCANLSAASECAGRYLKCSIGPQSRGAATDVRAWWPACIHYDDAPRGAA
jgi:hypothetical protein